MDKTLYYQVFWPESQPWWDEEELIKEGKVVLQESDAVFVEKETFEARQAGI